MSQYKKIYREWQANPEQFWMEAAEKIDWVKKPSSAINEENAPLYELSLIHI